MIHTLALVLYIGAFLLWLQALVGSSWGRGAAVAGWVAAAGVVAHAVALGQYTARFGELPLVGLAPSLSVLSLVVGLGLVGSLTLGEGGRVGIVLAPLMILLQAIALFRGIRPAAATLDFQGAWFALHVTLAFAGIGGMTLSAAAGALYLVQFNELKTKRLGRIFRFIPPLATLDRLGWIGAAVALTLLTLSLLLGWAWTVRFRNSFAVEDPKTVWGVLTWLTIAGVLMLRRGRGRAEWRGALASVLGFGVIVASYLVLRATAQATGFFL